VGWHLSGPGWHGGARLLVGLLGAAHYTSRDIGWLVEFFYIYLISHNFLKSKWSIKIFKKCSSGAVAHSGRLLPRAPRGVKSLPPARRQVRNAVRHGGRVFLFFLVFHF
jgi:hypothetical protein